MGAGVEGPAGEVNARGALLVEGAGGCGSGSDAGQNEKTIAAIRINPNTGPRTRRRMRGFYTSIKVRNP
jgi:hypothetical protein